MAKGGSNKLIGQSHFSRDIPSGGDFSTSNITGLVSLAELRKRKAEVKEQEDREFRRAQGVTYLRPQSASRDGSSAQPPAKKKRKKPVTAGKLSFGVEDDDESDYLTPSSTSSKPASKAEANPVAPHDRKRRLGPNKNVEHVPELMNHQALVKAEESRERDFKQWDLVEEAVKATEILVPFVFYDGDLVSGGKCKMKKGDQIWRLLDNSRKFGAAAGAKRTGKSFKEWARMSVNDLMLVCGELIIPHHIDLYHFMLNDVCDHRGRLFQYSYEPTSATPIERAKPDDPHAQSGWKISKRHTKLIEDWQLEGADHDPNWVKVVDRQWYEKHKHVYPASIWQDYHPGLDYSTGVRRDPDGNSYFYIP